MVRTTRISPHRLRAVNGEGRQDYSRADELERPHAAVAARMCVHDSGKGTPRRSTIAERQTVERSSQANYPRDPTGPPVESSASHHAPPATAYYSGPRKSVASRRCHAVSGGDLDSTGNQA